MIYHLERLLCWIFWKLTSYEGDLLSMIINHILSLNLGIYIGLSIAVATVISLYYCRHPDLLTLNYCIDDVPNLFCWWWCSWVIRPSPWKYSLIMVVAWYLNLLSPSDVSIMSNLPTNWLGLLQFSNNDCSPDVAVHSLVCECVVAVGYRIGWKDYLILDVVHVSPSSFFIQCSFAVRGTTKTVFPVHCIDKFFIGFLHCALHLCLNHQILYYCCGHGCRGITLSGLDIGVFFLMSHHPRRTAISTEAPMASHSHGRSSPEQ